MTQGPHEVRLAKAKALVGKRVEIPIHYDMWMRGARYGTVRSVGALGEYVKVKLDHPGAKRQLKVWAIDYDYVKVLAPVAVIDEEPTPQVVCRFDTLAEAEAWIAEQPDKAKVERGGYGIDAPEEMDQPAGHRVEEASMGFYIVTDLDHPGYYSVFISNEHGSSAEVAGKIGYKRVAEHVCANLNVLAETNKELLSIMFGRYI